MRFLFALIVAAGLMLTCGDDEPGSGALAPNVGTTKTFDLIIVCADSYYCNEAKAYEVCRHLGFEEARDYNCEDVLCGGNHTYRISAVTCWKP